MKFRILSAAAVDLTAAIAYYENQSPGLGLDFLEEYEAAVLLVCKFPTAWSKISPNHRRCLMRRFPFAILYCQEQGEIIVSGVMDLRMHPEKQQKRIN